MTKKGGILVEAEPLKRLVHGIFVGAGMTGEDAETVADVLVWANLRGVDSHGVMRVPRYVELIGLGRMHATPRMRMLKEGPATFVLDGDRAPGPVALKRAMEAAIGKARGAGLCWGLVRATTHAAAVGYFTLMAARENMAGLCTAVSTPNMAYHGARAAGVSTAPIAIAVPGEGRAPLMLDMASAVVAWGKIAQARATGATLPEGWALDADGNPTTDPGKAVLPMPLGGPKGAGLALMFECLTSLFVANPILADALTGVGEGGQHRQNALVVAVDIAAFTDPAHFRAEVDRLAAAIKALPRAEGVGEILVPGEHGDAVLAERSKAGIPIPAGTWGRLSEIARRFDVALPPVG